MNNLNNTLSKEKKEKILQIDDKLHILDVSTL